MQLAKIGLRKQNERLKASQLHLFIVIIHRDLENVGCHLKIWWD
jgi:hypothetical protein